MGHRVTKHLESHPTSDPQTAQVVMVIGGPGAGKGTQCARIADSLDWVHLSTGDLLRSEKSSGSKDGSLIEECMTQGKLVPIEIVMRTLERAFKKHMEAGRSKFLVDGFPRDQENIKGWENAFGSGSNSKVFLRFVLYLHCPENVMYERLMERAKTSGRPDDNAESIKKRFKTFVDSTLPVLQYYENMGLLRSVSAVPEPDIVFNEVKKVFDAEHTKPEIVFVLGGPGSGKGTQCAKIVKEFGYTHLSAGDLLRDEQKSGSVHGEMIKNFIKEGKIVPVEVTIALIEKAIMVNRKHGQFKFLIDGFPRNQDNLKGWNDVAENSTHLHFCLFFECPEEIMEQRILERGKTSGRADDDVEVIKKRFRTFVDSTMPVVEQFRRKGKLEVVDADQSPEEVFEVVKKIFHKVQPDFGMSRFESLVEKISID